MGIHSAVLIVNPYRLTKDDQEIIRNYNDGYRVSYYTEIDCDTSNHVVEMFDTWEKALERYKWLNFNSQQEIGEDEYETIYWRIRLCCCWFD